jgi:hypothetical protein
MLGARKNYRAAALFGLLFLVLPVLFGVDTPVRDSESLNYAGYSRFNLFVLPSILAGTVVVINALSRWSRSISAAAACLVIALNLVASPINLDGTKKPNWGSYTVDTAEHYYPYDDALLWLKGHHSTDRLLVSGLYYPYYFGFYFAKYEWHPNYEVQMVAATADEIPALMNVLSAAESQGYSLVLWQIRGQSVPLRSASGVFCQVKVFRNEAQALALFARDGSCVNASTPRMATRLRSASARQATADGRQSAPAK